MTPKRREIVFNKFGGKCAYCGVDLTNTRWHVDHANPVARTQEKVSNGGLFLKGTDIRLTDEHFDNGIPEYEQRKNRYKTVFTKPENDHFENYMPSCISCNINKGGLDIEGFRAYISRFPKSIYRDNPMYKVALKYKLIKETDSPVIFHFETFKQKSNI